MSGAGGTAPCPRCGGEIETYHDWKPFDTYEATCDDCGLQIHTVVSLIPISMVNDRRIDQELEPKETFVENDQTKEFDKE